MFFHSHQKKNPLSIITKNEKLSISLWPRGNIQHALNGRRRFMHRLMLAEGTANTCRRKISVEFM
jgi:hypothetical protein